MDPVVSRLRKRLFRPQRFALARIEQASPTAARPRRNRRPVRTRPWMPKERADLVRSLWRKDVLELASLLLNFGLAIHGQTVGKEPLG